MNGSEAAHSTHTAASSGRRSSAASSVPAAAAAAATSQRLASPHEACGVNDQAIEAYETNPADASAAT